MLPAPKCHNKNICIRSQHRYYCGARHPSIMFQNIRIILYGDDQHIHDHWIFVMWRQLPHSYCYISCVNFIRSYTGSTTAVLFRYRCCYYRYCCYCCGCCFQYCCKSYFTKSYSFDYVCYSVKLSLSLRLGPLGEIKLILFIMLE